MKVFSSIRFEEDYKRLIKKDPLVKARVIKTLKLVKRSLLHPSLRTHKIEGRDVYSVSVSMSIRILLHLDGSDVYLLRIGTHDEVY